MSPQVVVVVAVAVLFVAIVVARMAHAWWRFRGERVIVCPENERPAGVVVDAAHAAARAGLGASELRLSQCSRWPERAGCGQPCLSQIAASPADCLVRNILTRWYDGKTCSSCGRPFGAIEWEAAKPALLPADGVSAEWSDVAAEKLHETLASAKPLCFACHIAQKTLRERPDLIVDRRTALR